MKSLMLFSLILISSIATAAPATRTMDADEAQILAKELDEDAMVQAAEDNFIKGANLEARGYMSDTSCIIRIDGWAPNPAVNFNTVFVATVHCNGLLNLKQVKTYRTVIFKIAGIVHATSETKRHKFSITKMALTTPREGMEAGLSAID